MHYPTDKVTHTMAIYASQGALTGTSNSLLTEADKETCRDATK